MSKAQEEQQGDVVRAEGRAEQGGKDWGCRKGLLRCGAGMHIINVIVINPLIILITLIIY